MNIATLVSLETAGTLATIPGLRHGFFGRRGGVSSGHYAGLNTSETGGDDPALVARNRATAAGELGFSPEALATLTQIHSPMVHTVDRQPPADCRPEGDAMVTAGPGLLLGILTADCAPVLLVDPGARVIGAAHAGWKGAVTGIIANTVGAMVALGARPSNIVAAIGPTISAANYEVGDTFRAEFLADMPDGEGFFHTPAGGKPHFDLPGFVRDRLRRSGVERVEAVESCTYALPHLYYSHRYATHRGTRTGRQISVIGWVEAGTGA